MAVVIITTPEDVREFLIGPSLAYVTITTLDGRRKESFSCGKRQVKGLIANSKQLPGAQVRVEES